MLIHRPPGRRRWRIVLMVCVASSVASRKNAAEGGNVASGDGKGMGRERGRRDEGNNTRKWA